MFLPAFLQCNALTLAHSFIASSPFTSSVPPTGPSRACQPPQSRVACGLSLDGGCGGSGEDERAEVLGRRRVRVGEEVMRSLMAQFLAEVLHDERVSFGGRAGRARKKWWEWALFWREWGGKKGGADARSEGEEKMAEVEVSPGPMLKSLFFLGDGESVEGGLERVRERMPFLMSEESESSQKLMSLMRQVLKAERRRKRRSKNDASEPEPNLNSTNDALFRAAQKVLGCCTVVTLLVYPMSFVA